VRGILLAYDAEHLAGQGHRRRMDALRAALETEDLPADLVAAGQPVSADVIVVDSYLTDAGDRTLYDGRFVAAIDDLERRTRLAPARLGAAGGGIGGPDPVTFVRPNVVLSQSSGVKPALQ